MKPYPHPNVIEGTNPSIAKLPYRMRHVMAKIIKFPKTMAPELQANLQHLVTTAVAINFLAVWDQPRNPRFDVVETACLDVENTLREWCDYITEHGTSYQLDFEGMDLLIIEPTYEQDAPLRAWLYKTVNWANLSEVKPCRNTRERRPPYEMPMEEVSVEYSFDIYYSKDEYQGEALTLARTHFSEMMAADKELRHVSAP